MKYCIETTDNGCIETLEISDRKFQRESIKTEYGCTSSDPDFRISWKKQGIVMKSWRKYMNYMMGAKLLILFSWQNW